MATLAPTAENAESPSRERPLLEVRGLRKHYDVSGGSVSRLLAGARILHAVDGVEFDLGRQRTLGIVGESGCGKSTLAKMLALLVEPTQGSIRYNGEELIGLAKKPLRAVRPQIQLVFQDPFSSLNPRKRVHDIVGRPLELHFGLQGKERAERVVDLLEQVGLLPEHQSRYPHEFSGGQRQRIAIARALATEPRLLIADEPVSALDVSIQAQILRLLEKLRAEHQLTLVFISHDLDVVEYLADDVAVMYAGRIVEYGSVQQVFGSAQHPYTRALLDAIPDPEGVRPLRAPVGEPLAPINPRRACRFAPRCAMRTEECVQADIPLEMKDSGHAVACIHV